MKWIKGLALACAVMLPASPALTEPVRVFAAASLQGPLDAVAALWTGEVVISYGGSGAMARQVSQGAPADAVIFANTLWADWLVENGYGYGPPKPLFSNGLVVIGPAGAPALAEVTAEGFLARLDGGRLAMGQHMSVPAGIYAKGWLDGIGAWDVLRPHLAETENVRAALVLVARNETPLGIVYASDAAASDDVSVLWHVPPDSHPRILYPGLALSPEGDAFLDHVINEADIFVTAGFGLP